MNLFHVSNLKTDQKDEDGEPIGETLARKLKLLEGIQECLQEQAGEREQWITHVHLQGPVDTDTTMTEVHDVGCDGYDVYGGGGVYGGGDVYDGGDPTYQPDAEDNQWGGGMLVDHTAVREGSLAGSELPPAMTAPVADLRSGEGESGGGDEGEGEVKDSGPEPEMEELADGVDPEVDDDIQFQAYVDVLAQPDREATGQGASTQRLDLTTIQDKWLDEARCIHSEDTVVRCVLMVQALYRHGTSKAAVDAAARIFTMTPERPDGTSIIPLLDKVKLPVTKEYSCQSRHVLGEQGQRCPKCGEEQRYRSVRLPLRSVIEHFMMIPEFVRHVRHGPELLGKANASGGGTTSRRKLLRSVWLSPRMQRMNQRHGMTASPTRIPIAVQFFTDGIAPTESNGQDMWVVLMKVLNLPPALANDFIIPVVIVGSRKKPKSLHAYLNQLTDELGEPFLVHDSSTGTQVSIDLHLFSSAQDSMAMPLVGSHQSYPAKFACWKCFQEAERWKRPTKPTMKGATPTYPPGAQPAPPKNDDSSRMYHAFHQQAQPDVASTGICGYKDPPPLSRLVGRDGMPAVDLTNVYDLCAMHTIANVVERGWAYVLGNSSTWTTDDLKKFLETEEGAKWAQSFQELAMDEEDDEPVDPNNPSWMIQKFKKKIDLWDRNAAVAVEAALGARLPSSFHGNPCLLLHSQNKSAKHAEMTYSRSIKASEWKDAAISGMLPVLMMMAGVHVTVVRGYSTLFHLLKILCARTIDVEEVTHLKEGQHEIFLYLKDALLPTEQTISLHYLQHLAAQVLDAGPLCNIWSFPLEGYFAFLKPIAQLNKASPDLTSLHRVATMEGIRGLLRNTTPGFGVPPRSPEDDWSEQPGIVPLNRGKTLGKDCSIRTAFPADHQRPQKHTLIQAVEDFYQGRWGDSLANPNKLRKIQSWIREDHVKITQYDRLRIGDIEVQCEGNQRVARSNEWLVLKATSALQPSLGHVRAIYKMQVTDERNSIAEERLLLHVAEYELYEADSDLRRFGLERFVYLYRQDSRPTNKLIDVSCIFQQAIRMPDMRTRLPVEQTGTEAQYSQWLILDKGTLQNVDLRNPFKPSISINIR